jgi:hypothetical protein
MSYPDVATKKRLKKFPWQDLGHVLKREKITLQGWPCGTPFPGGKRPKETVSAAEFRKIYMALGEPGKSPGVLRFDPWSEGISFIYSLVYFFILKYTVQSSLNEDDDEYQDICLVASDAGTPLLRIREVDSFKANSAKVNAKRKLRGAKAAEARAELEGNASNPFNNTGENGEDDEADKNDRKEGEQHHGGWTEGRSSPDSLREVAAVPRKKAKKTEPVGEIVFFCIFLFVGN